MALTNKRTACPRCREEGKDSTGNHLRLFDDGAGGFCYHGHGVVKFSGDDAPKEGRVEKRVDPTHQMALIQTYPIREYKARKISLDTMEFFGVRTEVRAEDGEPAAHYYPYFDEHGNVTAYKCRFLPKDFSRGVVGKIKSLFGQHKTVGNKFLIAVEGEQDTLAARDMMVSLKGRAYNVVSLPNGANEEGTLDATTRAALEWFAGFEKVVLCLDNDKTGKATANALADYLCSRTDVRIASLPLKDTAAMWEADRAEEWAQCINNARRYVSDQIVLGGTTPLDDLLTPLKSGLMYTFLPKTSSKMHGSRTREMTTYIAPPKCGKSSLLRQKTYETLLLTDEHVGGFFLEETKEKTQQSIIAYHCDIAVNKFRANPKLADKYKVQEAYDTLLPRLHLFTHRGLTISDDLLERKLDYMVKGLGCKTVVIDHASFIVGTRTSKDERRDIDQMLTRLARHVEDEDYRLDVVAHIKRGGREQSRESKQKYPYWEILSPDDARGSGAFEQLSHNMIGIERQRLDPESENTRGLLRIRILHNREWGVEGVGDYLVFNENGKFVPVEPEY